MRRNSMYADLQMLVTCLSSDILSVTVNPKFLHEELKGTSAFPTWMEVGIGSERCVLLDLIKRHSVLSSFSFNLFCVIHSFTSEIQVCMS